MRSKARDGRIRWLLLPLAATGAVTSLAAFGGRASPTVAALGYVLAVMLSAARAGMRAGLAASLLAFLGLNFFFTPPRLTFSVDKPEDLVALVVFLLVSAVVGALISTALGQRARAERREREARLLHHLSGRLLSGEAVPEVLRSFAEAVTDLMSLARCEIATEGDPDPIVAARGVEGGASEVFPMTSDGGEVGRILVVPARTVGLGPEEHDVIRTFATQMALALERIRLASEARRAHTEAEESQLRAALFSSVTHDLRTPLASITAAATSLQGGDARFTAADRGDLLETIRQEAERLNRLVGNLLDLARIRAGALVPTKTAAAVEDVIEGVVARLQPALGAHRLRLQIREDLPEVPMDVMQIDQVLTNLLENAAKFSPAGSEITVAAARWRDCVEVRVSNTRATIPPDDRERVFEPFARADGGGAGTGLGLSIARAIVTAHGGKIRIEGTPGGGTTVVFDLPAGS